jgi:hypothetical protein
LRVLCGYHRKETFVLILSCVYVHYIVRVQAHFHEHQTWGMYIRVLLKVCIKVQNTNEQNYLISSQ